jgi:predicted transcriptional regulator
MRRVFNAYAMKQRSSFAITTLILETVARSEPYGISKTKIMQNVMLNYKRVNRYCAEIIARDLICYDTQDHYFHITDKGRFVLSNCNELAQFISPINRLMNKYRPLDSSSSSSSSSSLLEDSSYVWQYSQAKA